MDLGCICLFVFLLHFMSWLPLSYVSMIMIEPNSQIESASYIEAASKIEATSQAKAALYFETVFMMQARLYYSLRHPQE